MGGSNGQWGGVGQSCKTGSIKPHIFILCDTVELYVVGTGHQYARLHVRREIHIHGEFEVQHLVEGVTQRHGSENLSQGACTGQTLTEPPWKNQRRKVQTKWEISHSSIVGAISIYRVFTINP